MDGDTRQWIDEAMAFAQKAKSQGIAIMLRNDDEEIIVCSATEPNVVRALGESLACGFAGCNGDRPQGGL